MSATTRRRFIGSAAILSGAGMVRSAAGVPLAQPDERTDGLKTDDAQGKKAGWAIVGLGQLALEEILPAFAGCKRSKPVALVSGHRDKALEVAREYDIAENAIYDYQDFDRIAEDPRVEVVYIYSINAARYVLNEEPAEVTAYACKPEDDPRFREVPESVTFVMRYPSGAVASCLCSFGVSESRQYRVHCEKGFIDMDPAFSYRGLRLRTNRKDGEVAESADLVIKPVNQFTKEMDGFSAAVLDDSEVITPASMGIADMRILAAISESIQSGTAVGVLSWPEAGKD
ncbi:MAG: hypothetical protein B9S38_00760 [Verrucomicrobiia bacterium Tous-C4TDCM]|nr:MAG: hypothetical protein B9S38_00760 [Verrucomicrobiae bacterium Tous-C4TDCM]